jgi:gas vesicle protein
MADGFGRSDDHASGSGFMLGLLTGTVLGAGLGILLAPKSGSELRSQIGEQAASLGRAASEQLRRAGGAASGLVEKARGHAEAVGEAVKEAVATATEGERS